MAGLIEEIKWRTPQTGKGNRYLLITLSDRSGVYVASCFDEETQTRIEAVAKDAPSVLVQAELQWREGEDVPRITMRGLTLLSDMARRARNRVVVALTGAELFAEIATAVGRAQVGLGRDYLFDAETMMQVAKQFGPDRVTAQSATPPRLALVG